MTHIDPSHDPDRADDVSHEEAAIDAALRGASGVHGDALEGEALRYRALLDADRARIEPDLARARHDAAFVAHQVRRRAAALDASDARGVGSRGRRTTSRVRIGRLLAWSVGAHAVALLIVMLSMQGRSTPTSTDRDFSARVSKHWVDGAWERDGPWQDADLDDDADDAGAIAEIAEWIDHVAVETDIDDVVAEHGDRASDAIPDSIVHGRLAQARRGDGVWSLPDDLDLEFELRSAPAVHHPVDVAIPMMIRKSPTLRRRRLLWAGLEPVAAQKLVQRVLTRLARAPRDDGSVAASDSRSSIEMTALTLLPFLAEGHCSVCDRDPRDRMVAKSAAWLRQALERSEPLSPRARGLATLALAEDYMLGYGLLPTAEVEAASALLRAQAQALRGERDPWGVRGRDAVARAGLVALERDEHRALASLRSTAEGVSMPLSPSAMSGEALFTAVTASVWRAMLHGGRDAASLWSDELLTRFTRDGRLKKDRSDDVGEAALTLLALQSTYRTY